MLDVILIIFVVLVIFSFTIHIIYCPNCDVRIDVSDSDWADILIEKRYGGKEK